VVAVADVILRDVVLPLRRQRERCAPAASLEAPASARTEEEAGVGRADESADSA
jgi:hypothetical protein